MAGAASTGTHGSGNGNRNLSAIVSALDLVTADGELISVSRAGNPDEFGGMVLALGALGIVTRITLDVVPTYDVRQDVYDNLPRASFDAHFDEIMASAYSVSVFSDWAPDGRFQVWRKSRVDPADSAPADASWLDAVLASDARHPVPGMPVGNATEQLGVPGPWNERLPHFRLDFTPSSGDELQSEYLLPRADAVAARAALDDIAEQIAAVLLISEFRTVAADDLWISPSYRRDSVAFHFTWIPDHAGGRAGTRRDGGTAGPVRCPAALGQGVQHPAAGAGRAVRPAAGLPSPGRHLRSGGYVPQRTARSAHLRLAVSAPATVGVQSPGRGRTS